MHVIFFSSPEREKGLKKRAKLQAQENGQSCERRENGDGDSDNEPEEVRRAEEPEEEPCVTLL